MKHALLCSATRPQFRLRTREGVPFVHWARYLCWRNGAGGESIVSAHPVVQVLDIYVLALGSVARVLVVTDEMLEGFVRMYLG